MEVHGMKVRGVAVGILVAAVLGALLVPAPPAEAALPTCYRTTQLATWGFGLVPVPSAGSTISSTSCLMGVGASSKAVTRLQANLTKCYDENLDADGIFGPLTRNALARAQRKARTGADGVYGPDTRDALDWWTGGYWSNGAPVCDRLHRPLTR
jgi:hypothetical protein